MRSTAASRRPDQPGARGLGRHGASSPAAKSPAPDAPAAGWQRYRTGSEGRISHLKRGYGLDRSRLKGNEGQQIWDGWATLTYNAETYTTLG